MMIRMLSESRNMSDDDVVAAVESGDGVELPRERIDRIVAGTRHRFTVERHGNADVRHVLKPYQEPAPMGLSASTRECAIPRPVWPW